MPGQSTSHRTHDESAAEIDLLSHHVLRDPYPTYRRLRDHDPVHWDTKLNGWIISRYEDVYGALRDPGRFSSVRLAQMIDGRVPEEAKPIAEPFITVASQWSWMNDPPHHTKLRRLMNRAFTPRSVSGMEEHIAETVETLLAPHLESDRLDLVPTLGYPLPAYVLADYYGIPRADADRLKGWSDAMKVFVGGSPDLGATAAPAAAAIDEMMRYFTEAVNERRKEPRDDLISRLVHAEDRGDLLSQDEVVAQVVLVLAAAFVTTMDMIGNGTLALLSNRDQWERLAADPALLDTAIDELLRYDGPVQLTHRRVTEDIELHGTRISEGDIVYLIRGAANRDPDQFPDPDRLDVGREGVEHVAFGAGIHYCLGAALARLEGRLLIGALLRYFPGMRLDEERPHEWRADSLQFRGLRSLPVRTGR
ncbi:cytochrome P450 [Streptomyces sp. AJS327]|uniref:cytochrome P450 n=1 Tax=Streptomyces sp. AJS327 TaxID=2545265 RepID=UPI0015DF69D2|nr:cytochrome P450 [Streptomyces sp. AJS327]MBA0052708.1 cytochrome P450 [Streptomyces sp. AJS327]